MQMDPHAAVCQFQNLIEIGQVFMFVWASEEQVLIVLIFLHQDELVPHTGQDVTPVDHSIPPKFELQL